MGTKYKGSTEEVRALNAYIALARASEAVESRAHAHLKASGITVRQLAVLEALYHLGSMRQSELAKKMLCTPGNITGVVDKLEEAKLVERRDQADDRRCNYLALTTKGQALIKRVFPRHVRDIVSAMSALSAREQEELRSICRKLGLAAAGGSEK